jgi:hypothetical protein
MNNKLAKKIRKTVNYKVRTDHEKLVETLSKDKLSLRIKYALKILFKKGNITFRVVK